LRSEGPAINIYEEYKKINKLNLMKYATGIPGLEFERSQIISDSYSIHESLLCEPGKFSQMVKKDESKIRRLFNGNSHNDNDLSSKSNPKEIIKKLESNNQHSNHLLMTKAELTKSLAKLFSSDEEATSDSNQTQKHKPKEKAKKRF
jgi:hypothetical protein